MKFPLPALAAVLVFFSAACDRQAPPRPPAVPAEELPAAGIPEIDDKTDRLPAGTVEPPPRAAGTPAATPAPVPSMLALPEGEKWPDMSGEAQTDPSAIAGRYSDPAAPDLVYEFRPDGTWIATWDPGDGKNGFRMQGTFKIEYGLARLLLASIMRRDLLSGEFKRPRTMPAPQPRCLFRVDQGRLVMMGEMADAPFVTEPFTATDLVRQAP